MLYLANASSPAVRDAMRRGDLGQMVTPAEGRQPLDHGDWAADNGCFSAKGYPGEAKWVDWLERMITDPNPEKPVYRRARCLFAVAPDRFDPDLGDAMGLTSLARSRPWLPVIRELGVPVALVAQNGLTPDDVPWDDIDWIFLGGTTEWKLSTAAHHLVLAAEAHGKRSHMGRVNSGRRWAIAEVFGCSTCDGTFIARGPDTNLPRQRRWHVPNLFGDAA